MAKVSKKHKQETFESLMKRFKKSCEKSDVVNEVKRRESYEKPSSKRKRSRDFAAKKEQRRQEDQRLKRFPDR